MRKLLRKLRETQKGPPLAVRVGIPDKSLGTAGGEGSYASGSSSSAETRRGH